MRSFKYRFEIYHLKPMWFWYESERMFGEKEAKWELLFYFEV